MPHVKNSLKEYEFSIDDIAQYSTLKKKIYLEIGFGSGEILTEEALKRKENIFIGCEVYLKGIAAVMNRIKQLNIDNIRIFNGDGRGILSQLPERILHGIFLLFPDPWPKKRHNKRRIVTQKFLNLALSKLALKGSLIIATDHDEYFCWIENEIKSNASCEYKICNDLSDIFTVHSKYQKKSNKIIKYFKIYIKQ